MSLMYLAKRARPNILRDVKFLASKCSKPTELDLERVMVLKPDGVDVVQWVDASFMVHEDLKGHSGCVITLGMNGGVMATLSKKQKVLTKSSTEAELVAIDDSY
eukprot:gene13753-18232_t